MVGWVGGSEKDGGGVGVGVGGLIANKYVGLTFYMSYRQLGTLPVTNGVYIFK